MRIRKRKFGLPSYFVEENVAVALGQTVGWGQNILDMNFLHSKGLTGKGVKVAILDTGVDDNHPDLFGRVVHLWDATGEGFPADRSNWNGHGTGVAGLIGGKNNDFGIIGWAYDAELYGLKCLTENGSGRLAWILQAVGKAKELNVDIINLSLGASVTIPELTEAFEDFVNSGPNKYVIAATGNGGRRDPVNFPAAEPTVWGIGSMNDQLIISDFSSTATEGTDLLMPGENMLTTWRNKTYAAVAGTSFASPSCAGMLACFIQDGLKVLPKDIQDTGLKAGGRGGYRYPQLKPLHDKISIENGPSDLCLQIEELIALKQSNLEVEVGKLKEIKSKLENGELLV